MRDSLLKGGCFIILYMLLSIFFGYVNILPKKANGDHVWRQSDGLAIAYNYYSEGNDFFEPKMLNQLKNEGKAVGEFPILYYTIAQLYKIFGQHDYIYRLTCWLLCFLGYFALFRLVSEILNDYKWGIIVSLLTFSSPILIYYGISFLPDTIALSFIFVAWYYIYIYIKKNKIKYFILGMLAMTLATLLKITSLTSFIALLLGFGLNYKLSKKAISLNWKLISSVLISILIITSWVIFSKNYNEQNQTIYFFLGIAPAWELSSNDFWITIHYISDWAKEYFYPTGRHIIYIMSIFIIFPLFYKRISRTIYSTYLLSVIGSIAFIIIFFQKFKNHDYYMATLLFVIPMTLTLFLLKFSFLINKTSRIKHISQILFTSLLIASSVYAKNRTDKRFTNKSEWVYEELYNLESRLEEIGIVKTDLIIAPFDPSPNITLYTLKMRGWTGLNGLNTHERVVDKIRSGVKWIIIPNKNIDESFYLENLLEERVYESDSLKIYRLKTIL